MGSRKSRRRAVCEGLEPRRLLATTLVSNTTIATSIALNGEFDDYEFTAAAGDRIILSVGEGTTAANFEPYLRVSAPGGALVDDDWNTTSAYVEFTAAAAGTYAVRASELQGTSTGDYRLYFAKLPHAGSATDPFDGEGATLTSHTTTNASIGVVGDVDLYSVTAAAGDVMVFSIGEGVTAANFEPFMRLYGPDGAVITSNWDSTSAYIEATAATAGTYNLAVLEADNATTGAYRIQYVRTPHTGVATDPADGDGKVLTSNTTTVAAVDDVGDLDVYTVTAAAGDRLVFSAGEGTVPVNFEPYLRLYGPGGALIDDDWNSGTAALEVVAANAGTYTLVVRELHNNLAGEYRLYFAKLPHAGSATDPFDGEGATLASHTTTNASIGLIGDVDLYSVTVGAGDVMTFSIGEGVTAANFEPFMRLYNPDGTVVTSNWDSTSAYIEATAATAGTYNLAVWEADNATTGAYRIQYVRTPHTGVVVDPADGDGAVLASNTTTEAAVDDIGDLDVYTITAAAGDRLVFSAAEAAGVPVSFEPYLRLYGPGGALVDDDWNSATAYLEVVAASAGTYTLVVRELHNNLAGAYRLYFANVTHTGSAVDPFDGEGKALVSNTTTAAAVALAGDLDLYTVSAAAGDRLIVSLGEGTAHVNFEPYVRVYDPDGALVTSSWESNSAYVEFTAGAAGTYNVVVRELDNATTGEYRLHFAKLPHAAAGVDPADGEGGTLASNTTTSAAVATVGDLDLYRFTAAAGDRIVLSAGEGVTAANFEPFLAVYAPDGTQVNTNWDSGSAYLEFVAATGGTYNVMLRELHNTTTGAYRLYFARLPHAGLAVDPADGDGRALASNTTTQAAVGLVGDIDLYTFSASVGERVVVTLGEGPTAANFEPYLKLYSPDGVLITSDWDSNSAFIEYVATEAGTYNLSVLEVNNATTGQYRLHFAKVPLGLAPVVDPFDGHGAALVSNGTVLADLSEPGDIDLYTFDVSVGDSFSVTVGDWGGTAFSPYLAVYRPDGTLFDSATAAGGAGVDLVNATLAGTYTVLVCDSGANDTGDYAVHFVRAPGAHQAVDPVDTDGGGLASGQSLTAALTAGDVDVYTFTLAAGSGAVVRVSELGSTSFTPRIDVFGPNGARLNSQAGAASAVITLTNVALAGTYTVVVRDSGDDVPGRYAVSLDTPTGTDTRVPAVVASRFEFDVRHRVVFRLTEAVAGTLETTDLVLTNLTTGQAVPTAVISAVFNAQSNEVTFTFPGYPGGALPDGNYTAVLTAGSLSDGAGNLLAASPPLAFFVLGGDVNRSRSVDFNDLVTLAQNYNTDWAEFDEADFNWDGLVDFNDLVVLAQRYNTTLPAPAPVVAATSATGTERRGAPARKPAAAAAAAAVVQPPVAPVFATSTRIRPATVLR